MKRMWDRYRVGVGLLLLWSGSAWAQDEVPEVPIDTPVQEASALPLPYAVAWRWVRRSPVRGQAVVDVAAKPSDADVLLAVDDTGRIWRATDGGRIWRVMYGGASQELELSSDEDVLLDIDARLEEILTDGDSLDLDPEIAEADVDDAIATAVNDAIDQGGSEVLTDIEADPGFVLRSGLRGEDAPPRLLYIGDALFASVGSRLYLSLDDGESFGDVLDRHVYDVISLGSAYVALTDDGARLALDPRAWVDFEDGTEGRTMVDGEPTGEVLLAATEQGLWSTRDGQNWRRWGELREPVHALASHPDTPDVVWAATSSGLRRSVDRGLSFGAPLLPGRVDDVVTPWPDRVVIVRPGNVLESLDDGVTWRPATNGLAGVAGGRLAAAPDGGLFLATADGLWALKEIVEDAQSEQAGPWVGLQELVSAALHRSGVQRNFNAFSRRYTAAAVPSLQLDGYWFPGNESDDWNSARGTVFERDVTWYVRARLTWTPRRTRSVALRDVDDPIDIDTNVVIVGDEPLLLTGQDDYVVAARLQRNLLAEQGQLASTVTDLYRTRAELVAERPSLRTSRLQRQVNHELAIAELEARLDALTDGAVTRWQASQASQEL